MPHVSGHADQMQHLVSREWQTLVGFSSRGKRPALKIWAVRRLRIGNFSTASKIYANHTLDGLRKNYAVTRE